MQRENWKTQLGVILAVTGSAVGLGNFLRFPGQAALYGGGAFMIPYFFALVFLGIPLAWAEWTLGRYGGYCGHNSAPGIFRCILKTRSSAYLGTFLVIMPIIIFSYYIFIEAWCLIYAIKYLFGSMHLGSIDGYKEYFADMVGMSGNGAFFEHGLFNTKIICMVFCFLLNFYLIYCGITKGIERFCKLALPALLICSLIVLARILTFNNPTGIEGQGLLDGLGYVWNPTSADKTFFQTLARPEAWLAAAGQVFFSFSVGFGLIITYASYTRKNDDIALSSLTASSCNCFCEVVIGGMMVVPAAIMFLGQNAMTKENIGSSFALGFQVLPSVFERMPAGQVFGFLFFFLLFLAAVTSSISMLQPAIALIEEGLGLNRKASVALLGFVMMISAFFVVYFSQNLIALDTFDFWTANVGIFLMGLVQVVLFAWIFGIDKGMDELQRGGLIKIPKIFKYVIKYVTPLYLIIVFVCWMYAELPAKLNELQKNISAQLSIGFLLLLVGCFMLIVSQSIRKWEKEDKEKESKEIKRDLEDTSNVSANNR
ncbi:MAG: sodium-dependent transporter [Thermoguttaceae bacterium]